MHRNNIRRKAQLGLDIREGGIAIPIAPNMYYMNGRSHDEGGIGIGPNNKNGLEVEGGEVVKVGDKDIKVFSSVPLLRGVSPAQLVIGGANPNKVFKAQEEFKDRNRINDDGTRYETGGLKLYKATPKQKPTWSDFLYNLMFAGTAFEKSKPKPVTLTNDVADKPVQQQYIVKNDATRIAKPIIQNEVSEDKAKQLLEYYGATPYYPSLEIIDFIKQKEGFKPKIYDDGKGVPTIGYGFTEKTPNGKNILKQWKNKVMTKDEADSIMSEAIRGYLPAFIKATPNFHSLNNNQRDALFSYYYNIGHGNYTRKSPALQEALKNKDYQAITNNMDFDYNNENFGGARIRRDEERAWFNKKAGGIYIKPSKRGTFTAAAKKRGMGVQEFASKVLANKEDYSSAMVKKANFARNANRWKKEYGGNMIYTINGNVKNGIMSARPKAQYGNDTLVRNNTKWIYDEKAGGYVPVGKTTKYKTVAGRTFKKEVNSDKWIPVKNKPIKNNNVLKQDKNINKKVDYTINGTFDNTRPQYYAEKRLPIAGSQSIAEKAGLARSGWSYADNEPISFDYVPNINLSIPTNYGKNSAPRRRETKATSSKSTTASKPSTKGTNTKYGTPLAEKKESLYMTGIKNNVVTPIRAGMEKIKSPSLTGGGTQLSDGRWIGQYKPVTTADWIGLGSNLAGTVASYFMTKNAINKMPDPVKPIMAQAAKLKTRYNVEPQLTGISEAEQMNRAVVRRNTQSSNVSLAREQRLMNEARGARNQLYGQKENIETQLINQDRMNRQAVAAQNVATYNDYLTRLYSGKVSQNQLGISSINNLLSGLTGSVNNILGTIESRRATNNTLRAIAAANPNVDARLIGGFDYYIDPITKRKYNKNQQYIGTING